MADAVFAEQLRDAVRAWRAFRAEVADRVGTLTGDIATATELARRGGLTVSFALDDAMVIDALPDLRRTAVKQLDAVIERRTRL